jgi:hypothetical protein
MTSDGWEKILGLLCITGLAAWAILKLDPDAASTVALTSISAIAGSLAGGAVGYSKGKAAGKAEAQQPPVPGA